MAGEGVHRYQLISVISPASLPSSQPSHCRTRGEDKGIPEKGSASEPREKGKAESLSCQ